MQMHPIIDSEEDSFSELRTCTLPSRNELMGAWSNVVSSREKVVVICGDAGVGKSFFLDCIAAHERSIGAGIKTISLKKCDENELGQRFVRFSRETVQQSEGSPRITVCVDDVPAADERSYSRIARAVKKMSNAGCIVVIALRPECEGLIDALENPFVMDMHRLLARPYPGQGTTLTNGIPKLITALKSDYQIGERIDRDGHTYRKAIREMIADAVRDSLPNEEIELRLSLLLLGSGSLDDAVRICQHADEESLSLLEREAPFFGVSVADSSFHVAGVSDLEVFHDCRQEIAEACENAEYVALNVADTLGRRGEYRRMGFVLGAIRDSALAMSFVSRHGVDLVFAGHTSLVSRSIRLSDPNDDAAQQRALINSLAVAEVSAKRDEAVGLRESCGALTKTDVYEKSALRHAAMLGACRELMSGRRIARIRRNPNLDDDQIELMYDHLRAAKYIVDGKFLAGFDALLDNPGRKRMDGIPAAMLADDFYICEMMLGEVPARNGSGTGSPLEVFTECGSGRLASIHLGMRSALRILMGRVTAFPEVEKIVTRLGSTDDLVPQSAFLIAAAVADLRMKAYASASVRAKRAASLARDASADYLYAAASLVADAIEVAAGTELEGKVRSRGSGPAVGALNDLRRMLAQASRGDTSSPVRFDVLQRSTCSREILWALNLLLNDCGQASRNIRSIMPANWVRYSSSLLGAMNESQDQGDVPERNFGEVDREKGDKPVRIRTLGTFSVAIDGRELPVSALGARRGRNLVYALALTRGHSLAKREAINMVWGDYDYSTGNQKLYETVCLARKILRVGDDRESVILTGRSSGRIALDMAKVTIDVDEFEACANDALSSEGMDRSVVALASEARDIYSGGVAEMIDDPSGAIESRMESLATLHADVMVAGAKAALREGKTYLASQLSGEALKDDSLREDALLQYVTALGVLGRTAEIVTAYRRYKDALVHKYHALPSEPVRKSVDEALEHSGSSLTAEKIDGVAAGADEEAS